MTDATGDSRADWLHLPEVADARRRTTTTLLAAQVLGSLGIGAAPSVGVLLAESVAGSETWAGIARAATTVGAALLALPLASLAARHGRARSLALGWSLAAAGAGLLVLAAVTVSVPLLVLGMLGMGGGAATQLRARFAATDLAEPDRRARSLALVVWVGTLGAVAGPNLGVPGAPVEAWAGLPPLAGAFAIGGVLLAVTAVVVRVGLRPDPLLLAQRHVAAAAVGPRLAPGRAGLSEALGLVRASPPARLALLSLVLAHVSMVSVMTMTPVHLSHQGGTITFIGLTISLHVLGMFAFAPVVGAAADRYGQVPVIIAGQGVLAAAAVVGATGAGSPTVVAVALTLLGLGWSVVTVPASALLSESVPAPARPLVQGLGDTAMNAAAALGAIASGPLMALLGFPMLAALAGLVVVPVLWQLLRRRVAVTG
ncbi:MFS transporter [Georgenia yuyongxinii]|uniref:MFS transporter n=1 Tax=Georgenia yuyongxinii TaxID=2589797 RepID=UPI001E3C4E81|nr:MFS transporter [Georgenia yuyongxinii]